MTSEQWQKLLKVLDGKVFDPLPTAFIIDSPWIPGWAGISITDYLSNKQLWFESNLKAVETFPEIMFLPGFWSEFGMCGEPSAFGAECIWPADQLPTTEKVITDLKQIDSLHKPNPKTDGMLPLIVKKLKHYRTDIENTGHSIKFAVARGPLNIASFLMGTTEFLTAMKLDPERVEKLIEIVTDFLVDWIEYQIECFESIDGIFILDDIVGFIGKEDFETFALPAMKKIFTGFDVSVKFFHNDANGLVCAPYLQQIGINLFNFSFNHSINEMKKLTGDSVTLLGNIPPLEVLTHGSPQDVAKSVKTLIGSLTDKTHLILSCGGGMPPAVSTENIKAFIEAAGEN